MTPSSKLYLKNAIFMLRMYELGGDFSYAKNPSKFVVLKESQFIYVDAKICKVLR